MHIPFCIQKCIYCDFYSVTDLNQKDKFIDTLIEEISLFSQSINEKPKIDTIYFGGGTPSLLTPIQVEKILNQISVKFDILNEAEITIEANPGTVDLKFIKEYFELGINRVSLGIQSFDDDELKFLSRIHNSEEAINAYNEIRKAGFENVSIDLIFGIPGQTIEKWIKNLKFIKSLDPEHISAYNLIYEQNTKLETLRKKRVFKPSSEELEEKLFLQASFLLETYGYEHYEVSNFSKPGFRSRHNQKYWHHVPYFGFGPSSHSFYDGVRYWNYNNLAKYYELINRKILPIKNKEKLNDINLLNEVIMLNLRSDGLNIKQLKDEFNIDVMSIIDNKIDKYKNLINVKNSYIKINKNQYFRLNEIILSLIIDIEKKYFNEMS